MSDNVGVEQANFDLFTRVTDVPTT